MTEVPEHLLKRSRDRRAALGLGGGEGGDAGESAAPSAAPTSTPATTAAAGSPAAASRPAEVAAADVPPTPPKPVAPYIAAAQRRKRVPIWVMPVVLFLPLWAILYVNTLSKPVSNEPTQLESGLTVYASCSACHGTDGSGGAGRPLNNGSVLQTFPNIADQLEFVWVGSAGTGPAGTPYGDPARPGGQHTVGSYNGNNMPNWDGTLTQAQLLEVVRHEREDLSGQKVDPKQIAPDGSLLWPNGKPMLDATGALVDDQGAALFTSAGKLVHPSTPSS